MDILVHARSLRSGREPRLPPVLGEFEGDSRAGRFSLGAFVRRPSCRAGWGTQGQKYFGCTFEASVRGEEQGSRVSGMRPPADRRSPSFVPRPVRRLRGSHPTDVGPRSCLSGRLAGGESGRPVRVPQTAGDPLIRAADKRAAKPEPPFLLTFLAEQKSQSHQLRSSGETLR